LTPSSGNAFYLFVFTEIYKSEQNLQEHPSAHQFTDRRAWTMTRDKSIDLFILVLNVLAIMSLVGILSVMVTAAEAEQPGSQVEPVSAVVPPAGD
jgi:hypothetical protein